MTVCTCGTYETFHSYGCPLWRDPMPALTAIRAERDRADKLLRRILRVWNETDSRALQLALDAADGAVIQDIREHLNATSGAAPGGEVVAQDAKPMRPLADETTEKE